ncbi:hypothetical protein [Amycolatopsis sp. NPDC054798]
MSTPPPTAAAARAEYEQLREQYLEAQEEVIRMGDAADFHDTDSLRTSRLAVDSALARWHACAPDAATAWWPGGWRLRGPDGRIRYGTPEHPWAAREQVEAAIAAATPEQVLFRVSTPAWIAVDQTSAGPVALDAAYWDERMRPPAAARLGAERPRPDEPGQFDAQCATAGAWLELAKRQLDERVWAPTAAEQSIATDLWPAVGQISTRAPSPDVVHQRLVRMTYIASTLRLAMVAGGWGSPDDEIGPPAPDSRADLPSVLRAVYPLAVTAERWYELASLDRFRGAEAALAAGEPVTDRGLGDVAGLIARVPSLERIWASGGDLSALLTAVAVSGAGG